jgi:hypothetical protein
MRKPRRGRRKKNFVLPSPLVPSNFYFYRGEALKENFTL